MTEIVKHPTLGEIVYTESFWTGKKGLTVNGAEAKPISKKEFRIGEQKIEIIGSYFTGISLNIDGETVQLSPKPKWYEVVLAVIPVAFLLTWGNVPALCAIFPVIGGAIGGALGAIGGFAGLGLMKKTNSAAKKVLFGLGACIATILVAYLIALGVLALIA